MTTLIVMKNEVFKNVGGNIPGGNFPERFTRGQRDGWEFSGGGESFPDATLFKS